LGFDNLKKAWEDMAKVYADKNSAYEQHLEEQISNADEIGVETVASSRLSDIVTERGKQLNQIPIMASQLEWTIDTAKEDSEGNPNPTYMQSVLMGDTNKDGILDFSELSALSSGDVTNIMPNLEGSITSPTPLNMWANPILFNVISAQALMGVGRLSKVQVPKSTKSNVNIPSPLTKMSSQYSIQTEPQEVDFVGNEKALGFTAKQYRDSNGSSPSLFTGIVGTSPDITFNGNTSHYSARGWDDGTATFSSTYTSGEPFSDLKLPASGDETWTIPTGFTYQNSQYGVNAISEKFGDMVNFMKGGSSYYANSPTIPGFSKGFGISKLGDDPSTTGEGELETDFELGLPSGYAFGAGQLGNSRYIKTDLSAISTGTHTRPFGDGTTVSFSNTKDGWFTDTSIPTSGTPWTPTTSYWDNTTVGVNPRANPVSSTLGLPLITGKTPGKVPGTNFAVNFMGNSEMAQVGFTVGDIIGQDGGTGDDILADEESEIYAEAYLNQAHATGFTLGLGVMSDSQFKGIPESRTTRTWTQTTTYYDSLYTINNPRAATQTLSTLSVPSITGTSPGKDPATNFAVNFMGNSEIPQVGTAASDDFEAATDTTDQVGTAASENYEIAHLTQAHATGFTLGLGNLSDSQFKGIPESRTDKTWSPTTSHYDSLYPINNPKTHAGVLGSGDGGNIWPYTVDFMSGVNSYYSTLSPEVSGFTKNFGISNIVMNTVTNQNEEVGLPTGYTFSNGQVGNSRFIKSDGTALITSTGTHTEYHTPGITFSTQKSVGNSYFDNVYGDDISTGTSADPDVETDFRISTGTKAIGFTSWGDRSTSFGDVLSKTSLMDYTDFVGIVKKDSAGDLLDKPTWTETENEGGTKYYTAPDWEYSNTTFAGGTYSFNNGLPAGSASDWEIPDGFTYQGGITYTTTPNSITDTFGGPVDFLHGTNSYFLPLTNEIPGFTRRFGISNIVKDEDSGIEEETGLPAGYITADGDVGVSRFLRNPDGSPGFQSGESIELGTGTHTMKIPGGGTITFPGPVTGVWGSDFTPNWGIDEVLTLGENESFGGMGASKLITSTTTEDADTGEEVVEWGIKPTSRSSILLRREDGGNASEGAVVLNPNLGAPFHIDRNTIKFENNKPYDQVGALGYGNLRFETLYNANHTAIADNKYSPTGITKFNITAPHTVDPNREYTGTTPHGIFSAAVVDVADALSKIPGVSIGLSTALGNDSPAEPYVVFDVGESTEESWTDIYFPRTRIEKDVQRIGKFLGSNTGETFILQQNLLGTFQQYKPVYDPTSTLLNVVAPAEGLGTPMLNFSRDKGVAGIILDFFTPTTYTEWIDTRAGDGGVQAAGAAVQSLNINTVAASTYAEQEAAHKPLAFAALDWVDAGVDALGSMIPGLGSDTAEAIDKAGVGKDSKINSKKNMQMSMGTTSPLGNSGKGDIHTLFPMGLPVEGGATTAGGETSLGMFLKRPPTNINLESSQEGMPFYFIDLRDNTVIYFRAYIDGLSDSISPSWNSENYIGRSEPVYTYTNTEREIGFNLKLFAQTKDELNMIYRKLNRLTSLCYPEYKEDTAGRQRMKPPLTKFRLGELFGSEASEMVGFIKSLTHTFPDDSPWEIKQHQRVPKYIEVDITYQVIHSEVPSLDFARLKGGQIPKNTFYGINQDTSKDKDENFLIGV